MLETITNNKKCSRFTLNNRGITLASLTIYVVVATIVVGILAFLNAQFFSNITELTNESSIASENLKLKASLVRDLKSRDVNVLEYSNWGFRLSNNVKYEIRYNEKDDNYAVFRNNVKICSSIYATEVDGVQSPYFKYNPENNTLSLDLQFADSKNGSYSSLNRENNTFLVSNIRKKNEVAVKTKYEYEIHITYDLNNGTSSEVIEPQTAMVGSDIRVTTIEPTKRRSTFLGWSTNKDAEEPDYLPGSKFKGDLDTTLYAIYRSSLITSIANKPVLGNGMTGVYYDENQNEIPVAKVSYLNSAINTKNGLNGTMYNYLVGDGVTDTKETKWANAKTEDGSYWVWVPRYAYKITYYTDETKLVESNTKTKYGDIDVLFLYETMPIGILMEDLFLHYHQAIKCILLSKLLIVKK